MNKRKTLYGRVMALVLAFVMVCSSLGTSTITAYAAGSTGNIVTVETDTTQTDTTEVSVSGNETVETETVIEETSQEESEDDGIVEETTVTEEVEKVSADSLANTEAVSLYNAEGEESTYTGSVEEDYWGKKLVINEGDMEEAGMTISAETIVSIIETERSEEDSFSVVELNMNSVTDAIDTEVWNAVVNAVDSSLNGEGRTELRYNQSGGDAADENWCFGNPTVTEDAISFGVTYSAGNAGEGVSVQLDSVSIPADDASLGLYTDENRGNYSSIIAALGEGAVGRVYDSEGTSADNLWANIEKGSFDDEGQEKGTINISVGNIKDFKAGDAYLVKAESYTGKIEGDWCGDRLTIEQWVMEEAGIEVTDQAFIDIIEAQEQTFGIVEFNLNSVRESISKDLWNAAVSVIVANDEGNSQIRFHMSGDKVADINWNFDRPTAIAEEGSDITLAATWSAGEAGEGITVSFANNEFPADEVYLNLHTDQNKSDYDTISEAVGTNSSAELYNGENTVENAGAKIERDSFEDNGNEIPTLNISVGNIKNLSVNTGYVVKSVAYRGHVEGDWCGDRLTIEQWVMEEAGIEVTDQALIDIINAQDQKFGIVEFNLNSVRESISKDLWNAAVAVVEADENGNCQIRFNMSGDNAADINWNFDRPTAIAEEGSDITLAATWSAGEAGEGITVSFANNEFPADEVYLNLHTDQNKSDYGTISEAVGTKNSAELYNGEQTVENAGAKIERNSFEENGNEIPTLNISVGNIKNLSVNTEYVVKSVDYTGRLENWDGWECLWIAYYEAGKEEAFTAEEIKDILAANESVSVNEVYIEQPYDSENVDNNTIDGSVVNAALPLLKGDEDSFISFAFSDENAKRNFRIFNPSGEAAETSVSIDAGIHVIGEDESTDAVVYKNGQVSFDGLDVEREDLEIVLSRESDNGKALMGLFGESNRQLALDNTDIFAEYRVEENELIAYISGSDKMENDREYSLSIAEYKGIVEDNVLFIYPWHVELYGLEYTEELIVGILNDYAQAGTEFARVEIGFVDEESVYNESDISAKIYNAAIKVTNPTMDSPNDNLGIGLKYIWYKADGAIVWNYYWENGMNPAELEEDIKMQYQIGFDENGNVIMTTNIPELSDTYVDLEFVPNDFEGPDLTDDLKTYFGDVQERNSYILSPIPEMDYVLFQYGAYKEEDSRVQILIERIDVLENNTVYEVLPYNFGHEWVDTWEDGTEYWNLYISASEIGKDTFDKGDIERSLTYRKYLKKKFDCIYIEQGNSYDDKGDLDNIIRKEDYNYIRNNFLNTDNENASIVYVFDNSDEDENGIYLQDQVRYEFMKPSAMTKDMDASVNFAWIENYNNNDEIIHGGIDVYMPKTTVPASGVNVQIHADNESFSGEMLCNSLGDIGDDGTMCKIITDKKTLASLANDVWLGGYTADIEYKGGVSKRTIHQFHISDAQKLPQNAYSRIYPVQGRGDDVLYLAKKEALETSVSGNNILWKSFTPNTATVAKDAEGNYYIEPIKEDDIALYGSYCLTDGGTPIVEIFGGRIEKKVVSMKFTNASVANPMEMELPPNGETWDALNHLDLRFFPTGTGLDNSELEWTVDSDCIEFMVDNQGNPNGEIKAVKAGEAIITVTAKNDPTLEATAKVIVKPAVVDEIKDILDSIQILAIDGYDKTLADLADELPEGFAWVDGKTTITEYKNRFCYGFPAIYTSPEDERTAEVNLPVMICNVESVLDVTVNEEFSIENGGVLDDGRTADLEIFSYIVNSIDPELPRNVNDMNAMLDDFGRDDIRFTVSATSNPKNILVKDEESEGLYHFTANSGQKGKKTFTLSLNIVDVQTKKVKTYKKLSSNIMVVAKPLFDWQSYLNIEENMDYNASFHKIPNGSEYPVAHDAMSIVGEKGKYIITQPADSYYKITAKSLDTAVCKLGSVKVTYSDDKSEKITTIPYEIKKGGTAFIQLTAADEVKSTERISFEVFDMMPKVVSGAATIDVTMTDIDTEVKWQMLEGTTLGEATVSGKGSEYFDVSVTEQDTDENEMNDTAIIGICLNNRTIKTGKYKLDITVPVTLDEKTENFTTTVTITVKASKPVYTAKQTRKVNLYYDNEDYSAQGILTLSNNVQSVALVDQDTDKGKKCDYDLFTINDESNLLAIRLKGDGDAKNTKGKLLLTLYGVYKQVEVPISIKTENKKPDLVLTSKSSTVYPNYGQNTFGFKVINKETGENAFINTLEMQNKDGSWTPLLNNDEPATIIGKNNTYNITYSDGYISGYATTQKKATDKLYIRVKPQGTTSTITLNYSVKVDPAIPALVPSSKTLTLNMNEGFYRSQSTTTTLSLKETAVSFVGFSHETGWIEITGADAKAIAAKNANLDIHWMTETDENGKPCVKICARVNDNDSLKTGSYKYNVTLHQVDCKDISCQITVKVVDVGPSKCLSVSSKGSIDVLDRYTSAVKYTPKIKNLQGTLRADFEGHESYLKGPDAYKFATMVEGNALCVYARDGEVYSTKQTYYVTPVFVYENEDGQTFEIEGKQQKIKVKQGKPKVTITSPEGNTLYRERSNELNMYVSALLNKKLPTYIEDIELTNYTGDLVCEYNEAIGVITLSQHGVDKIFASGKSWNLKFNVYYGNRAVNEKPVQVTYKLVVK